MPHSYAIAIFRFKDYQAANIPVLPVGKRHFSGEESHHVYIIAFAVATLMLSLGGYAGYKYSGGRRGGERLVVRYGPARL
ncbi:protoheme IX farnesyltransferase [Escherichia coli]|uniref:Protoheme IX farnesyltransferase n=1 Tax=Escherichia coli TaxID=562 RepID=A0A377B031_ECOLX|nr:protoheme IX farnesyltransferase [Escherichia coli]